MLFIWILGVAVHENYESLGYHSNRTQDHRSKIRGIYLWSVIQA